MGLSKLTCGVLVGAALLAVPRPARAEAPDWLPRYEINVLVDVPGHEARGIQRVTWTNRHAPPADRLVFNVASHYVVPDKDVGLLAKTLEILRMKASDAMDTGDPPMTVEKVTLNGAALAQAWREDLPTALEVQLPAVVRQGESVTVEMHFRLRLPQKQGRWGQWQGVTFLSNWNPVLAYYDDNGWQPVPFIPWHQPFFNEAGIYTVRATLPADHVVASSSPVAATRDLGNGYKQLDFATQPQRDFALLGSARYQEFAGEADGVRVRVLTLPGHDYLARVALRSACYCIPVYNQWFGPYPYPEFTVVEGFFGWNGNECSGLVMIDNRMFSMPELGEAYVDYLVAHETCHQWWYGVVGTNGYCETWMDEGLAGYFSHRLTDRKTGRNNPLLGWPKGLGWLPNIHRETFRYYGYYGTQGRGELMPVVQDMKDFRHLVNLLSMCYDKGSRVVGLVEERLGEAAFLDFHRVIYAKYRFRILRVADYRRELEEFTGRSWEEFFRQWLYSPGQSDWQVDKVHLERLNPPRGTLAVAGRHATDCRFYDALHTEKSSLDRPYKVTILVRQTAEINEPTTLGLRFKGEDGYQYRVPIDPQAGVVVLDEPPTRIEPLADNTVRIEMVVPARPTQVSVDPDKLLVDRNPTNNHWHTPVKIRPTFLYTPLDDTDVTVPYDTWQVAFGPWFYPSTNNDPWYQRSNMVGLRVGGYRTQFVRGGAYAAYRTDYRDIVAGVDATLVHQPLSPLEFGFNAERRLATVYDADSQPNRASVYGRYVIDYGSSLYLQPFQYVEVFGLYTQNFLPFARHRGPGAMRWEDLSTGGVHYHLNYLTPYWDPEGGIQIDSTYSAGVVNLDRHVGVHQFSTEVATVKGLPEGLGWLSRTRVAVRAFGAAGFPDRGEYFALGGSERFRGYDVRERQGSLVWVGSVEWRVPLVEHVNWDVCDHVLGVRNVYAAAFYDVGAAYVKGEMIGDVAHAVGVGLRVDVALFSFIERAVLRVDAAKTLYDASPWQFWFGISHPF